MIYKKRTTRLCKNAKLLLKLPQTIQCHSVKYGATLIKGDRFYGGCLAVNLSVISRTDKQKYLL